MIPGARPGLKVVFAEAKRYETVNSPEKLRLEARRVSEGNRRLTEAQREP
jgi:hypothetical protein